MADIRQNIKESHRDYYAHVDGPIGGDDRFVWVSEAFFNSVKGKRILEIGCGEGSLLAMLKARGNEVWGVDISQSGVEKTEKKGIPCRLADASNEPLPYEDNFFDVVVTLETIEHVENPHRMLWEIKRVLKEGGDLLISIPGEKVYHPFIYPGLFGRANFSEFLDVNGFKLKRLRGWGQAPMLAHWSQRMRQAGAWKPLVSLVYYLGRKRNLLMRKRLGTPVAYAYCLNFLCTNIKKTRSRIEEVASETTPLV